MIVSDKFRRKAYLDSKVLPSRTIPAESNDVGQHHSVAAVRKEEMKTYFVNLGMGCYGMYLLKTAVCDWLKLTRCKPFIEELVFTVGIKLKTQRWVCDAEVMQVMVDDSLVNLNIKKKIFNALLKIREPLKHIREIVSEIIQNDVRHCFAIVQKAYRRAITDCIKTSAFSLPIVT